MNRLFYIEDDPETSKNMTKLFEQCGFLVIYAPTVAIALQKASSDFDLILSDIGLPDGDGWEVMKHIRKYHGKIPAIALSALGTSEDIQRSKDAGFDLHLIKPIGFPVLLQTIHQVCRKSS